MRWILVIVVCRGSGGMGLGWDWSRASIIDSAISMTNNSRCIDGISITPTHDHHHHPHDAPSVTSGRVSALTFARRVRLRRRKTYRYHCCHCWSRETHFLQFMIHFHNLFHFRLCTHVEALCKTTITQPPFQYEGWFLRLTEKRTDKAFVSRGKHICTTVAPVYQL